MNIAGELVTPAIVAGLVLLWARRSKLDLGLRRPTFTGVWEWIAYFILWCAAELAVAGAHGVDADAEWLEWLDQLTLVQALLLLVLVWPLVEELLFRGAIFSSLLRRWGPAAAILVPSLIWGLLHVQYEAWVAASIAGSGVILAVARWKSGSIWVPLALHAAFNLFVTLVAFAPSPAAG